LEVLGAGSRLSSTRTTIRGTVTALQGGDYDPDAESVPQKARAACAIQ
jgi:hypothetical protein